MKLTYRQEGTSEPKIWPDLDLGRFRSSEIELVERATKMNWGTDFKQSLLQGNMLARRALLWILIRRDHAKYRLDDLDPFDNEVVLELNAAEWQDMFDEVEKSALLPGKTEEDRSFALSEIQKAIDEARATEADPAGLPEADEPVGKALELEAATSES